MSSLIVKSVGEDEKDGERGRERVNEWSLSFRSLGSLALILIASFIKTNITPNFGL